MCQILADNGKLNIALQVVEKGRWDERGDGEYGDQNTTGAHNVR